MDRLFCMQVFVRVVETGAFTRAADALGISKASATAAVAQLEKRLGVRLLNRTTRKLSLTDEGQSYYGSCVRLLGELVELEDGLSGTRLEPRGRLRISVPQSFVETAFYPGLKAFMDRYPGVEVEVVLTDRAVNLVEEGIDCAIRGLEIAPDSGLVVKLLSAVRWLTCGAPGYLAERGRPSTIDDLAQHNCVRFISPSTGRTRPWMFNVGAGERSLIPEGNLRMTSYDATVHAARAGAGLVQVPDALGYPAVRDGALLPVLTAFVADAPPLVLVYPGNCYLTAKVRAFSAWCSEIFPKQGWWQRVTDCSRAA